MGDGAYETGSHYINIRTYITITSSLDAASAYTLVRVQWIALFNPPLVNSLIWSDRVDSNEYFLVTSDEYELWIEFAIIQHCSPFEICRIEQFPQHKRSVWNLSSFLLTINFYLSNFQFLSNSTLVTQFSISSCSLHRYASIQYPVHSGLQWKIRRRPRWIP